MVFLLLPWTDTRLSTWQEEDKWSFSSCRGETYLCLSLAGGRQIILLPRQEDNKTSLPTWQGEDRNTSLSTCRGKIKMVLLLPREGGRQIILLPRQEDNKTSLPTWQGEDRNTSLSTCRGKIKMVLLSPWGGR